MDNKRKPDEPPAFFCLENWFTELDSSHGSRSPKKLSKPNLLADLDDFIKQ
jgi:hypothetical protein